MSLYILPLSLNRQSSSKEVRYLKNTDIVMAWGEWLRQWKWDWWTTLTFRYPVSSRQAHRLWKRWLHALESEVHGKVHYVRGTELQKFRGDIPHYHALIKGVKGQTPRVWERVWHGIGGLAKIDDYDVHLGASYYLAKYYAMGLGDIILSKGLEKLFCPVSNSSEAASPKCKGQEI